MLVSEVPGGQDLNGTGKNFRVAPNPGCGCREECGWDDGEAGEVWCSRCHGMMDSGGRAIL